MNLAYRLDRWIERTHFVGEPFAKEDQPCGGEVGLGFDLFVAIPGRRKREAYVHGGGDPAPAVVTFTTATACLAVDELLQALTGFRSPEGWVWQRTRRFDRLADRRPGADSHPHCAVCSSQGYWGRGDIEPFLDRSG